MSARVDHILDQIELLSDDEIKELKQRIPDELILSDWAKLSRQVLEDRRKAGLPPPTEEEVLEECHRIREEVAEFLETEEYKWPTNFDEAMDLVERINAKYGDKSRA